MYTKTVIDNDYENTISIVKMLTQKAESTRFPSIYHSGGEFDFVSEKHALTIRLKVHNVYEREVIE